MLDNKLTRVHTILFTEACPLECRYCYLKDDEDYKTKPDLEKAMILKQIEGYDKQDTIDGVTTRLLLTGGEPFLYPELIYEIIKKYGTKFQYSFNTSGYLFTEEMLEFLSHYTVDFVLSIDGGERLTNYLRPLKTNKYRVGYFKQFKKIIPTLLYYFPQTPFRMIVNPRYVDLVYEQYLEAERLGFKYFTYILDFECRPSKVCNGQIAWNAQHSEQLQEQMELILEQIISGFQQEIARPQLIEVNNVIKYLVQGSSYNPDKIPCQLFAGRSMLSSLAGNSQGGCMELEYPNLDDAKQALWDQYHAQEGKCSRDNDCCVFDYCAHQCCPKNSLDYCGKFFEFEDLECAVNKVSYKIAIALLAIGNEDCAESMAYKKFLSRFTYPLDIYPLEGGL